MQITTETRVGIFVFIALGIFFYMTMQLGVFRLDRSSYRLQSVYFDDVSGLDRKAEVKIAGVKVGWVESIDLVDHDSYRAKAHIMIKKRYVLHSDAHAVVRQEGLLGTKYLEVNPGDPHLPELPSEYPLAKPGRSPVSIDEILHKVDSIATHIEGVTSALHSSIGGAEAKTDVHAIMKNVSFAVEKMASFADTLDRTLSNNEHSLTAIIDDVRSIAREMRSTIPHLGDNLTRLSNKLESDFLPSIQESIGQVAQIFDSDVHRVANRLEDTTHALESAALSAQDGFKSLNSVATKIDEGKGLFGKLINEDETYHDIKFALSGLKNYFAKIDKLSVVLDIHGEYSYRPSEHMNFEDGRSYVDIRIHPDEDHFYLIQFYSSIRGRLRRQTVIKNWYDERGDQFLPSDFFRESRFLGELIGRIETIQRTYDDPFPVIGAQIGKIFKNVALRFGLIQGWAGVGFDFEIPFGTDAFRWVTTFEAFDFRGRERINDDRPHFKWTNRVFVLRNIYAAFGADDFISRENTTGFFGLGVRFGDDDLKYLAAKLGFLGGAGT